MSLRRLPALVATAVLCFGVAEAGALQLKQRPAKEWIERLDRPERLRGLKVDEIVKVLGLKPGQTVADLGAGSGAFEGALSAAVGEKGTVYAVDIDQGFLDFIGAKAKEAGLANIKTVLGEFTDPRLGDAKLDVGFFHDVLHHIEKREDYLKNLARYMKPDGRIVVIELDKDDPKTSHREEPELQVGKEQLAAWMDGIGFHLLQEHTFLEGKWYVVYGRK